MSDETPAAPAQPPVVINMQYVKDLSFENPNAPQSLVAEAGAPQVELSVNVAARGLAPDIFEVTLKLNATAKHAETIAFIAELDYAGVFTLNGIPEDQVHPVLMIEGPRMLFPFARALIANATREGGFPPLMVQPIDFVELYRREAASAQAAGEPTATV